MDFKLFLAKMPFLISGVVTTIELMVVALFFGLLLSILFTLCSYSKIKLVRLVIYLYTFIVRGSPLLVQIFLIYYGSGQFELIRNSFLWNILKYPFGCAVMALAINSSGYCVILFRGMINAIPKGEFDACRALGMSRLQMVLSVIAKRFVGVIIPAYSNEVVIILKSTSLASTITLMDLMGITQQLISETYATINYLIIAGVCYLIINLVIMRIFKFFEKRYLVI